VLKTRIIGVLVVKGGTVVQSVRFHRYLPVGAAPISVEYLNRWGIDEIVILDIDATPMSRPPDYEKIQECSRYCQVPLAVGGGIRSVSHIEKLIRSGADKVVINSAAVTNPRLMTEGTKLFGNQCMIASIDAKCVGDREYEVFIHSGKVSTGYSPRDFARIAEQHGAGEILLNSIDRDGSKLGYDLELIRQVVDAVNIPMIVCGGVSHPRHFLEPMDLGVSAVAAANFFHYTEHSVIVAKGFLARGARRLRSDMYTTYEGHDFDENGRASKVSDSILEGLRFEYIPEEVI
jgi:cyclase